MASSFGGYSRHIPSGDKAMWIKPKFVELRFGFEVTMYSEYR